MDPFIPAALYPIVDVGPRHHPEKLALAEELFRAGVPWLQLRAKDIPARDHLALATELIRRARPFRARIIVNDRLDIALASGAAGVHLGQDDLPLEAARSLAQSQDLVLGISTHSEEQAIAAESGGADYIGFGPMFATRSKKDALPPRARTDLQNTRRAVRVPIVAIGGITEDTASAILQAGADSVAMISGLEASSDPAALARRLAQLSDQSS